MQSQHNALMAGMNANIGPADGTPMITNAQRPQQMQQPRIDPREQLNTYIYDYFLRNSHSALAKSMIDCGLKLNLSQEKASPNGGNTNGVSAMDTDEKLDLPKPHLPSDQAAENSFLLDWWCQFWDIFTAARLRGGKGSQFQYIAHTRVRMMPSTL